jgi:pyruvate kinase
MTLPGNQTKIICTIGPASSSPQILESMMSAGMNVARLNLSHGDFESHQLTIQRIRKASEKTGRSVAIMADLPGPKIRIGDFAEDPVHLAPGQVFSLTTDSIVGNAARVSVMFAALPEVVRQGDDLFLNDGLTHLEVHSVAGHDVHCRVVEGGSLSSGKGLNLPGVELGIGAFTDRDRECVEFAVAHGVDAVSQSFVESADDIYDVRRALTALGSHAFVIAKIERSRALDRIDEILKAADGVMIARGDLGVEIPIERIAGVQKSIMQKAGLLGKPVITATQMLESMTISRMPTRAEATDVANAVLDGTDCVMLSGESAVGRYPVEAVRMLVRIADEAEGHRPRLPAWEYLRHIDRSNWVSQHDLISMAAETVFERTEPVAAVVRTERGGCARSFARFKLPVWIFGVTINHQTSMDLHFSYGVFPVLADTYPEDWTVYSRELLNRHGVPRGLIVLAECPSDARSSLGIVDLAALGE